MELVQQRSHTAAKEAFVAGLSGTSKLEICLMVAVLSLSIVVCEHVKSKQHPRPLGLALELLLIIYPQLLICMGAMPLWPTLLAFALAASACFLWDAAHPSCARRHELPAVEDLAGPRKSFVGIFRGALMASTCLCILAVDFRAFPRRYAKAEAYGTGYMDVGVGGVVLTAGLVSPVSRWGTSRGGAGGGARRWRPPPFWRRLLSGLRGAAACWALGLARLVTTRAVNYQEHVGEYGVHWNFFDTVAVVALLSQAVALPPELLGPAAVAVTAAHQAALTLGGLGSWVMSPHRGSDLLSLNKEGLVSCLGFWALYLWGAALAHALHTSVQPAVRHLVRRPRPQTGAPPPPAAPAADDTGPGRAGGGGAAAGAPLIRWWVQLATLDGFLWVVVAVLESRVERISRRSCNAAYIVWIVAQCLGGMLPLALWQALATAAAAAAAGGAASAAASGTPHNAASGGGGDGCADGHVAGGREGHGAPAALRRGDGGDLQWGASGGGGDCPESASRGVGAASQRLGKLTGDVTAAGGDSGRGPLVRGPGNAGPRVLQAINANQLPIFLAANLLTGAINLSMDTLQVADWPARALVGAYITCICGLALFLDARGWRLKL
ncbi:hypothetical protein PLESTB_000215100 [Pleodorina starrii]|uniref:GPI-anchored wall transfer protein n=1 Tax=Pleodorina starrii TaxID=330485 RepID=A0A9W6BC85_9CHLO|nr:hypothetical protein PLESTM_001540700 [Pleodorina starrii]GLC49399.1 hypothetical protein PLESTB_000215100 [Pleodorina starrii]GLC73339.1 hypothetical protein PLESTF_001364900 [Pleodorina starrii]